MIPLPLGQNPAPRSAEAGHRVLRDLQVVHTAGLRHWHDVEGLADTAPLSTGSIEPRVINVAGWQRVVTMLLALTTAILAGVDLHLLAFGLVPLAVIGMVSMVSSVRSRTVRATTTADRS